MRFKVGDYVLLSTKNINLRRPSRKLTVKFLGPYKIEKEIGKHGLAYQLKMPNNVRLHNVFNITNLEPFQGDPSIAQDTSTLPDNITDDAEDFEVERIITHKYNGKRRKYLVKWKGYDTSENSWVLQRDFNTKEIIHDYEQQLSTNV
ncbi:uncharacterized protein CPUR_08740 [Claviceps purpurea 20.1]|uniref:Chromo domain-containing protein n=1 Tax=Claviceps purpurea (strain 20.1) TaxID=1111077 RepID=M1VZB8_CLAP2|nr:uncharacterized protein CPUR_08740 [Claviceps purpurea 20.1]